MITWSIKEFAEVDSTQILVSRLGARGAPEGTVVVAERQTAGKGRHGRSWNSPEGGLYMSLLLRPPASSSIQTLPVLTALAVSLGIELAAGLKAWIRWPNDIVIDGKKVSGVIAESSYSGQTLSFVTVGIGVNCNSGVPSDPIGGPATSIAEELGLKIDIARLRQSILEMFGDLYLGWLNGADAVKTARSRIGTIGKRVIVMRMSGERLEGLAEDVEPAGNLVLNLEGRNITLRAEDVDRLREI